MPKPRCFVTRDIAETSWIGSFTGIRCLRDRMCGAALIDVVITDDISDEDAVKDSTLQRACNIGPIFQVLVPPRAVAWMRPQARRLMTDAVHVEGVEANLSCQREASPTHPLRRTELVRYGERDIQRVLDVSQRQTPYHDSYYN